MTTIVNKTAAFTIADADLDTNSESVTYVCTGAFAITIPATGVTTGGEFTIKSTDGLQTFTTTGATVTPPLYMSVELYGDEASVGITCLATGDYSIVGDLASTIDVYEAGPYSAFSVKMSANKDLTTASALYKAPFNTIVYDSNSDFDTTNNWFVAPEDGLYVFHAFGSFSGLSTGDNTEIQIYINGVSDGFMFYDWYSASGAGITGSKQLKLLAGDTVAIWAKSNRAGADLTTNSYFNGSILNATPVLAPHGVDHHFSVNNAGTTQTGITNSTWVPVEWGTVLREKNVAFDLTGNTFIAPSSGLYNFSTVVSATSVPLTANINMYLCLSINDVQQKRLDWVISTGTDAAYRLNGSSDLELNAGDEVRVEFYHTDATNAIGIVASANNNWFAGHKVSGSNTGIEYDSYDISFNADIDTPTTTTAGAFHTAVLSTVQFDKGGNVDTTNNKVLVPVSGSYQINAYARIDSLSISGYMQMQVHVNGVFKLTYTSDSISTTYRHASIYGTLDLQAGDELEVKFRSENDSVWEVATGQFSGHLVRSTTKAECSFYAYLDADQTLTTSGAWQKINLNNTLFDYGSNVDTGTNRIDIPENGRYIFNFSIAFKNLLTTTSNFIAGLQVNSSTAGTGNRNAGLASTTLNNISNGSVILDLVEGDYVELFAFQDESNAETARGLSYGTYISGYRLVTSQDLSKETTDLIDVSGVPHVSGDALISNGTAYEPTQVFRDEVSFKAILSSDQTLTNNTWTQIQFASEEYDNGDNFDTSTYEFTAPVAGTYVFNASLGSADNLPADTESRIRISVNSSVKATSQRTKYGTAETYTKVAVDLNIKLSAGDVVSVETRQTSGGDMDALAASSYTQFSGHLLTPPVTLAPHGVDHIFSVHRGGTDQTPSSYDAFVKVEWTTIKDQINVNFDLTNNRFVVPSDGWYEFDAVVTCVGTVGDINSAAIYIDGVGTYYGDITNSNITTSRAVITAKTHLKAGQYVEVYAWHGGAATDVFIGTETYTYFTGSKITGSSTGIEYDSYDVGFRSSLLSNEVVATPTTRSKIPFDTVSNAQHGYDAGGNFDTTNNYFVCPVSGIYAFYVSVNPTALDDQSRLLVYVYRNVGDADEANMGFNETSVSAATTSNTACSVAVSGYCDAGDKIEAAFIVLNHVGSTTILSTASGTQFGGHLVQSQTKAECSFRAYLSVDQTNVVADSHDPVDLDAVQYDKGGNFDTTTHKFTAPEDGRYFFSGRVRCDTMLVDEQLAATLMVNGVVTAQGTASEAQSTGSMSSIVVDVLTLEKDDLVNLCVFHSGATPETIRGAAAATTTYLTGHRLTTTPTTIDYDPPSFKRTFLLMGA